MLSKILITGFGLLMLAAFVFLLGTAGAADLNQIDFKTLLIRAIIGVAVLLIGFTGLKITAEKY